MENFIKLLEKKLPRNIYVEDAWFSNHKLTYYVKLGDTSGPGVDILKTFPRMLTDRELADSFLKAYLTKRHK